MLARRAPRVRALAHRALFARSRASAASAADAAPIWTGDDDDRTTRDANVWTRHGSPEARSFAHRGILAGDETKVRAGDARRDARRARTRAMDAGRAIGMGVRDARATRRTRDARTRRGWWRKDED